jgi:hypothetical protein
MLLSFQPWKERHPLTRGMSPMATGSGGPSGLEDSPSSPRAKTGNARSPEREFIDIENAWKLSKRNQLLKAV